MKISEAAAQCRLSIDTIRFYESSGLIPPVHRDQSGRRVFSQVDVEWLKLIASLRETGMPMTEMKRFAALYKQGDVTIPERRSVLRTHAKCLEHRREALDRCADLLAYKLARYDEIEGESNENHHRGR